MNSGEGKIDNMLDNGHGGGVNVSEGKNDDEVHDGLETDVSEGLDDYEVHDGLDTDVGEGKNDDKVHGSLKTDVGEVHGFCGRHVIGLVDAS